MAPLYRMGWASVVALAGVWAGSTAAQPIDFGQNVPSSAAAQPSGLNSPAVPLLVQNLGAPVNFSSPAGLGQYLVYVNGDSDLLLQQVRRIEPGAFRRSYNNRQVIQSGRFLTLANAQARVTELESRGILSEIVSPDTPSTATPANIGVIEGTTSGIAPIFLETAPLNSDLEFVAPNTSSLEGTFAQNLAFAPSPNYQTPAYYVAIPSRPSDLATLATQLTATGLNPSLILARASRRGAFIAVGPYSDRLSAEVMVASIKSAGFNNARVYFGY
jgi:hypothetical protein